MYKNVVYSEILRSIPLLLLYLPVYYIICVCSVVASFAREYILKSLIVGKISLFEG